MKVNSKTHRILACCIGNILEWFDYTLYGTFATIFSKLFFPPDFHSSQFMVYLFFAFGFISRPFGGVILGHISDKVSRKATLLISILLISIPTFILGLLPTYETIGMLAPIALAIIRILQGIALGGEFTGSMVYLVEQSDRTRRGLYGCIADFCSPLGVLLGFICAQVLSSNMSTADFETYGWRLPFIFSIFIAILGIILRKNLIEIKADTSCNVIACNATNISTTKNNQTDTIQTENKSTEACTINTPFTQVIKNHKKTTIMAACICAFGGVNFYLILTFLHNFLKSSNLLTDSQCYLYAICANLAMITAIPISGFISDYIGRKKTMIIGTVCTVLAGYFMFNTIIPALVHLHLYAQIIFAFSLGIFFGARAALFAECYPKEIRCTALAVAFGLSHSLFAGTTPMCAEFLYNTFHQINILFYVVLFFGILCVYSLYKLNDRTGENLL